MLSLSSVERPKFDMPLGACDMHMHAFGPLDRYPSVSEPQYTLPDGKLSHYQQLMKVLELERFVVVQPSFYGTDNSCLVDTLKAAGANARGVVMVEDDVADATLEHFHSVGVRGIRLDLFKRAALPLADIKRYIANMAERVKPLGWHLQFYAPGYIVRDLIDYLGTLDTNFIIDHMGYMLEEDGLTDADFQRLLNLLNESNGWLKLSGPYRIAKNKGYDAVSHIARAIVDAAPHKAVWGSDWPHIPQSSRNTGELLNLVMDWAPDAAIRRRILVDNPLNLFDFT
uniref:Amidohydrolase 2 n=2 Tax=Phyllobacteriaceae TaxID=69277 RepID=Q11BY1_CHESB